MVKFKIQSAERINNKQQGLDMEMIQKLRSKGIPVNFVSLTDDNSEYINVVDVLHLQDMLTVLVNAEHTIVDMRGFPHELPTITIYDDLIE